MTHADRQNQPLKSPVTGILLPVALRNFVRNRETGVVMVAIVIGVLSGLLVAIIAALSEAHPFPSVRHPFRCPVKRHRHDLLAAYAADPDMRRRGAGAAGLDRRQSAQRRNGRRDRGQRALGRPGLVARQPADLDPDVALQWLWRIGRARGRLHTDLRGVQFHFGRGSPRVAATCGCWSLAARPVPSAPPFRRAAGRIVLRLRGGTGGLYRRHLVPVVASAVSAWLSPGT